MFVKQSNYDTISMNRPMKSNIGLIIPIMSVLILFGIGLYVGLLNNNVFDALALLCYLIACGTGFFFVWLIKYTQQQFHAEYPVSTPKEWYPAPYVPVIFPMIDGEAIIIDHNHMYYKSKAFISRFISTIMRMILNISFIITVLPLLGISLINHQYEGFIILVIFFSFLYLVLYGVLLYPSSMLLQKSISWTFQWENIEDILVKIKNPGRRGVNKVLSKEDLNQLEVNEIRKKDLPQTMKTTHQYGMQENQIFYILELYLDTEKVSYTLLVSDNQDELEDFQHSFLMWLGM